MIRGMLEPYLYGLFVILLYFAGNFFTVVILEHKLKNVNLKHTLAAFAAVALSGIVAYVVPVTLFGLTSPFAMQLVGISAALAVQGIFWMLWFKGKLRSFAPALILAFILAVLIALLAYNIFVWYARTVARGAVQGAVEQVGSLLVQ